MANPGARKDPLPVFCFKVSFEFAKGPAAEAFFRSVSGLRYETEVIPVAVGGMNNTTFQLPGATKWSNIVLKQGYTGSSALLSWRDAWTKGTFQRCDGTITQLNTALQSVASWKWYGGWPAKWELSDLDASKSEIAIESLEIAIHGLAFGEK